MVVLLLSKMKIILFILAQIILASAQSSSYSFSSRKTYSKSSQTSEPGIVPADSSPTSTNSKATKTLYQMYKDSTSSSQPLSEEQFMEFHKWFQTYTSQQNNWQQQQSSYNWYNWFQNWMQQQQSGNGQGCSNCLCNGCSCPSPCNCGDCNYGSPVVY